MNVVDIILSVILLYGLIRGFFRGFFAELASLAGFIAGIYGAVYFSHYLSDYLAPRVTWNMQFVNLIAFAIIFILIVFTISLAGKFLTKIASFAALGLLNRMLGAVFGIGKAAFITSVIIMFFAETNEDVNIVEQKTLQDSVLYEHIRKIAPALLPSILREVKEMDVFEEDYDPV